VKYRYNRAAELEMLDAALYYEAQREGLGVEFVDEVEAGISTILEAPHRWPEVEAGLRRYQIHRFPYGLFYRIVIDEVEIVAVADLRRRPGYWRNRLR
jgi:plasmid stabilization system protein ParE